MLPFCSHCSPVQASRIVQSPRSWKQPDTEGVDTHGSVVVVVLVLVDVEVEVGCVVVVVNVVVVLVLEVDVVVGIPTPQCASEHVGTVSLASAPSNVTRHVSDGSAQCENWMMPRSHSVAASHRGAAGSTHRQPAKKEKP